jgi:hypothetical protein
MYTKVDVVKPGDNMGVGGNKKDKIILFDFDDVLTWPARDANGILITGDIVFKPGAYMITLYATQQTIKANPKTEGDPDNKGVMQTLQFDHPGDTKEILEFRANWMNRNIGAIVQRCSTTRKNLYGNPCASLQLEYEATDDKDKNSTSFTLKTVQKGPDVAIYEGTTTFSTVTGTVAAGATAIDLTNGEGRYQLTTGAAAAAAIATLTNPVSGLVFTLLGSGGAFPSTIASGATFLLANGTGWTAIAGSTITFKVFKDGAASFKAIETNRT